jgi:SRSO17 transposase
VPGCWLLAEWPPGQPGPSDYWLSDLPAATSPRDLVRLAKIRWRIEHDYRELKYGPGPDHFEGRSYAGWHRHVTLTALAQAFCTQLRYDPKAPAPGLTLYVVFRELQALLAIWTGACRTCHQPITRPRPAPT